MGQAWYPNLLNHLNILSPSHPRAGPPRSLQPTPNTMRTLYNPHRHRHRQTRRYHQILHLTQFMHLSHGKAPLHQPPQRHQPLQPNLFLFPFEKTVRHQNSCSKKRPPAQKIEGLRRRRRHRSHDTPPTPREASPHPCKFSSSKCVRNRRLTEYFSRHPHTFCHSLLTAVFLPTGTAD